MSKATLGGLILIGVGILCVILGNVQFKTQEEVIRLGEFFRASATNSKTYPIFRYVGSASLGGGVVLMTIGFRKPTA